MFREQPTAAGKSGEIQRKWKQEGESKLNKSGVASLDHFCSVLIRLPASTYAEFPLRNLNGLIVREWNRGIVHNTVEPQRITIGLDTFRHIWLRGLVSFLLACNISLPTLPRYLNAQFVMLPANRCRDNLPRQTQMSRQHAVTTCRGNIPFLLYIQGFRDQSIGFV